MNLPLLSHNGHQLSGILNKDERDMVMDVLYWEDDALVATATLTEETFILLRVKDGFSSLWLTIPEGCRKIAESACYRLLSLERVSLPSSLEEIEETAFGGCKNLQAIEGLEHTTIKKIPTKCFSWCLSLKEIPLPETLTHIKSRAFQNCESLTRLPGLERTRVEEIGQNAFLRCKRLEKMHLPDTLRSLGAFALSDTSIQELFLPHGVSELRTYCLPETLKCLHIPDSLHTAERNVFSSQEIWCSQKNVETVYAGLTGASFHPDLKLRRMDGTLAHLWASPVTMTRERTSCMGKVLSTQDSQALLEAIPILAPDSRYPERNWLLFSLLDQWQGDLEEEVHEAVEKPLRSSAEAIVRQIYLAGNREGAIHFLSKGYVLPGSLDSLLSLANDHQDTPLAAAILMAKQAYKKDRSKPL